MSVSDARTNNNNNNPPTPFQFSLKQLLMLPVILGLFLGIFIWRYPFSVTAIPASLIALFIFVLFSRNFKFIFLASAIFFSLCSFAVEGFTDPSEYFRFSSCSNRSHVVGIALHSYYERHGHFPPAYIADKDGRPMHSWRVLILPYLDHDDVYKSYRMDEPWDGPNNRKLWNIRIPEYECPAQQDSGKPKTNYVAVTGSGTMWPGAISTRFEDIRDGVSNTIIIVETADSGIHWMEPRDLDISTLPMTINPKNAHGISSLHREVSWQQRLLGAHAVMADGSVLFLQSDTPSEKLKSMLLIDKREEKNKDGQKERAE